MLLNRLAVLIFVAALAACDAGGPGATASSDGETAKPEVDEKIVGVVEERQAVFKLIKKNFLPLAFMALGRMDYDAARAEKNANRLPVLFGMIGDGFVVDTRGSGVETDALDNIWDEMDKFKEKAATAENAAINLAAVAGDESQFNDAVMAVRDACGSCHDDFRVEQE